MDNEGVSKLQALFVEHPELAHRLDGVTDPAQAAARLAEIGIEHGIAVDAPALEATLGTANRAAGEPRELDEQELDQVAGGSKMGSIKIPDRRPFD